MYSLACMHTAKSPGQQTQTTPTKLKATCFAFTAPYNQIKQNKRLAFNAGPDTEEKKSANTSCWHEIMQR